jgi:carboxypeptidase C (cathepsin A)
MKTFSANLVFNPDENVVTEHTTTIKGRKYLIKQRRVLCQFGMKMESDCGLFYTYYERSDVKDRASRPLVISFNGGASVWIFVE